MLRNIQSLTPEEIQLVNDWRGNDNPNEEIENLNAVERSMLIDHRISQIQVDTFTSQQNLTHDNIRSRRQSHTRSETVDLGEGCSKTYYFNTYSVLVSVKGQLYSGSVEYGSHLTRKMARQIATKRAFMNALNGNTTTYEEFWNLQEAQA